METSLHPTTSPYVPTPVYSCGLVEDILAEIGTARVLVKNRTDFHTSKEDVWENREMAKAAVCYILGMTEVVSHIGNASIHHHLYPWNPSTWAPNLDYRENLISACCFLLGEIERLDRQRYASQDNSTQIPAVVIEAQERFEAAGGRTAAPTPPMPEVVRDTLHKLGIDDEKMAQHQEEEDGTLEPLPPLFTRKEAPEALRKAVRKRSPRTYESPISRNRIKDNIINIREWGKSQFYRKMSGLADLRVLFM